MTKVGDDVKTKLTVTIDEEVLPKAKEYARRQGVSLSRLIEDRLRQMSVDTKPSFSQEWRGRFRPADRAEERYERLAKKYP